MENVIEAVRGALAPDATPEAKAAGVAACRAILAALEATPGQSFAAVPASPAGAIAGMLRGMPPEQLLDLAIAKLRAALPPGTEVAAPKPMAIKMVQLPAAGGAR